MNPEAIAIANSDQVPTKEFDRFINTYYSSKMIFLGNLTQEQALRIWTYKHTFSRLSKKDDPSSQKFYKKFLLIAGQREFNAFLTKSHIEDERYREFVQIMFKHVQGPVGRMETGTRVHIKSLDLTFMYGFYGLDSDSDRYILNRVDVNNLEQAFRRISKRKKGGVVCGHPKKPLAYAQDSDGVITDLLNDDLASIAINPAYHYLFAPGAFNEGYYAVIGKNKRGERAIHFNQFEFHD